MLLGPGTLIAGRYIVEQKIGEGSWGEVWAGRHTSVGMKVALKVLLDAKAKSHDAVIRFKREAKFLGRIQSDYVARVLDFLDDEIHGLVLVMELVQGDSLAELLRSGTLSVERALEIGYDLVAGLCDLHAARVIHRDLKPGNVILRPLPDGRTRAVIIDFSMGRLLALPGEEPSITQLTAPAMAMGTLPYMAPEQVLDSRKAAEASDIYAVGAILYRCLVGTYVFDGDDDVVVARKKLSSEAPTVDTGRSDVGAQGLERAVGHALRRRPQDRYPDAHAMLRELGALRDLARARAIDPEALDRSKATRVAMEPADSRERTDEVHAVAAPRGRRAVVALSLGAAGMLGLAMALGIVLGRAQNGGAAVLTATTRTPSAASSAPVASESAHAAPAIAAAIDEEARVDAGSDVAAEEAGVLASVALSSMPTVRPPPPPFVRAPVSAPAIVTAPATTVAASASASAPVATIAALASASPGVSPPSASSPIATAAPVASGAAPASGAPLPSTTPSPAATAQRPAPSASAPP